MSPTQTKLLEQRLDISNGESRLFARLATETDQDLLMRIAQETPIEDRLISFNAENAMKCVRDPNSRLYIYSIDGSSGEEVVGIGVLKWDETVSVRFDDNYFFEEGEKEVSRDSPLRGFGGHIRKNIYIGGAYLIDDYRKKGHYERMFDHRFREGQTIKEELEADDGLWRPIITEPFGAVPKDGFGPTGVARKASSTVTKMALKRGFKRIGMSTYFDMGPTLIYDPEGKIFEAKTNEPIRFRR